MVKIFPRRHFKLYGDDAWGFMLWTRSFKNKVPKKDFCDFLVVPEKYYYPDFLLKFLSIFRQDAVLKFNWLLSPLFDTLSLVLVFFLSYFLFNNLAATLLACAIYILFPPLVFQMTFLHARAFGYPLFNLAVILIICAKYFDSFPCLAVGLIAGGLLLNSHAFATQALIFVSLGLSLLGKTPFYAGLLPLIFIAAIVLSRGFYLRVLRGHLILLRNHYRNIYSHQPYEKINLKTSFFKFLFWGFVLILINLTIHSAEIHPLALSLSDWSVSLFAMFILTSFLVPLRFIGQGYRYIEYAIVPISVLFSYSILQYEYSLLYISILALFILYVLLSVKKIYSHFRAVNKDYINIVDDTRLRMFEFIKSSSVEKILCIPSGLSQSVAYFTGRKILWTYFDWDNYAWLFPKVTLPLKFDLSDIFKKYDLDAVLLHAKFARKEELKAELRLIHQEGPYLLLGLHKQ